MDIISFIVKSFILGIVEGITEFLPVSSTGHLIIFQNLIGFKEVHANYLEMYTYVIQLGAILAVVMLYWKKIKNTFVNFFPQKVGYEESGFKFWGMIFIACIPGLLAVVLDDIAEKYLSKPIVVALALFFGGIWMIYAENKFRTKGQHIQEQEQKLNITVKQALIIGLFQCLAIIPGMSRSASTIIGGWVAGLTTVLAAEFSFFLAIPVMVGMSTMKIIKIGGLSTLSFGEISALIVGFVTSMVVAFIVIDKFILYLKRKPMKVFAKYRMVFAVVIILASFANLF